MNRKQMNEGREEKAHTRQAGPTEEAAAREMGSLPAGDCRWPSVEVALPIRQRLVVDPAERPVAGRRQRERLAVAQSELGVVKEMARCLREISEGRVPR